MRNASVFGFLLCMWALMILGGGIVVLGLGSVSVTGYGDLDGALTSVIQATITMILVVLWILVLTKMRDWIFKRRLNF